MDPVSASKAAMQALNSAASGNPALQALAQQLTQAIATQGVQAKGSAPGPGPGPPPPGGPSAEAPFQSQFAKAKSPALGLPRPGGPGPGPPGQLNQAQQLQ